MNSEKTFPSIESKISLFPTFMLQGLIYGMLLMSFMLFVLLPVYGIYKRGIHVMFFPALFCFAVAAAILIPTVRDCIDRKKQARKIIVNETGLLFYNQKSEIVSKIGYADLVSSGKTFDVLTVNTTSTGVVPLLEIFTASEKDSEKGMRIDMNLPLHVVKNKYNLYANFLRGISVFRPDLNIDPVVFNHYFINPATWQIDRKSAGSIIFFIILAALLICGLILWLVFSLT
ncbi:hypothetical protein CLU96_1985 [Chryseobacterium sp. 52]|uniref:hypothetical protein n=1 Tax=Chryseobacterium sp. 52 TaxID=2035213 RepID=UPI000C19EE6C|nr:hypothetical protein [Chryseobacterium sp. 52]PIF44986.1 hypothetical protein CLU96_1985 [Chryseobacterium sp. 52]